MMDFGRIINSSSVQSLSGVWLFATPWTATRQASLSITNSWSLLKLMSIKLVMPSSHVILCHPLLLLPSILPSIRVFSNESVFTLGGQNIGVSASTSVFPPPLALFAVMLPKAHLTSHSRMSVCRWVTTPSWLCGSWRSFFYSSSVYFCHLFLIASASVGFLPFLSFIEPIFAWHVPLVSLIFLKRSLVFHILLFSSIALHWSLRKAFLPLLAIPWNSALNGYIFPFLLCFLLLFFSQLFVRPPQTAILLFLHFFSMGMVLIPVSCTMSQTSIHSSSSTLSIRSSPLNLFLTSTV